MRRSLTDIVLDSVDAVATGAINERFNESSRESSEGAAEYANPATVTQPVHHARTPAGEPLNNVGQMGVVSLSPVMLLAGGMFVLLTGLAIAKIFR